MSRTPTTFYSPSDFQDRVPLSLGASIGTLTKIRTQISGFGGRCPTIGRSTHFTYCAPTETRTRTPKQGILSPSCATNFITGALLYPPRESNPQPLHPKCNRSSVGVHGHKKTHLEYTKRVNIVDENQI